jgi:hypothetical protein
MQPTFDPVRKRKFWLDFNLAYETEFVPEEIPPKGQPLYLSTMTNSLITAYLLGLVDQVKPTLEYMVAWMESQPEPDIRSFREEWDHWRDGWYALYLWRRTRGLCKWLCGIEGAEQDFGLALQAEWQAWYDAPMEDAARDFHLRQESLVEHLSMALAANDPYAGLQFRTAAGIARVAADHPPLLFLGQWACLHLHCGNDRDAEFVATGTRFLRPSLWPEFLSTGRMTVPALWLKAIYWDSGAARTAEEAIARAYDFLPSVTRPDFVPA